MRILENDHILLKPVEEEDLPFLLDLRWDQEITENIIHQPISMRDQQRWFENLAKTGDLAVSVFLKNGENERTLVGMTGLYDINHRHQKATLRSTRIHSSFQRNSIATQALDLLLSYGFQTLNLNRISADYFRDNAKIASLLRSKGFVEEGVLRSFYFHEGVFKDVIQVSLLRAEFIPLL